MRRRLARHLCALADGTLRGEQRDALLGRMSGSPELTRALNQQLIAVKAIRRLDTPAPTELRERIQRTIRTACTTRASRWDDR